MNDQEKKYLRDDLINDIVKAREEAARDGYVEDAALLDSVLTRLVQLENSIRELGALVK